MKHFLYITLLLIIVSVTMATKTVQAEPILDRIFGSKKVSYAKGSFTLNKPFNIVSNIDNRSEQLLSKRIAQMVKGKGAHATQSNGLAKRNIRITMVDQIKGLTKKVKDGYSINVYKDYIEIEFTSAKSMRWAYAAFKSQYDSNVSLFEKLSKKNAGKISQVSISSAEGRDMGGDEIDATLSTVSFTALMKKVDAAIANNISIIYIHLVSPNGWRVECETIKLINPKDDIYGANGYSFSDMRVLYDHAQREGIEIVPVIDFTTADNELFENFTGHPIHSVEGMRFTKAFLKEFCENTNFERISIGKKATTDQEKYVLPLVETIQLAAREVVIFEIVN